MRFLSLKLIVLMAAFLAPAARDPEIQAAPAPFDTPLSHVDGYAVPVGTDTCSLWPRPDQTNADDGANSYLRGYRINAE